MPMIDLTLPEGTLSAESQTQLLARLTHILLKWEEAPDTPQAKSIAWAYVQEVKAGAMTVGGTIPEIPRYRVMTTVPQQAVQTDTTFVCLHEPTWVTRVAPVAFLF